MVFQWSFQWGSRVFEGSFKDGLRTFQGCFNNLSMKFCFAILLQHESHCSYSRRRRACLSRHHLYTWLRSFVCLSVLENFRQHCTSLYEVTKLTPMDFWGGGIPPMPKLEWETLSLLSAAEMSLQHFCLTSLFQILNPSPSSFSPEKVVSFCF